MLPAKPPAMQSAFPLDSALDPNRCPLCGGDNRCALEIERATGVKQEACWCTQATFTPGLLGRVPAAAVNAACICAACATGQAAALASESAD
jgi:hypothetical protein